MRFALLALPFALIGVAAAAAVRSENNLAANPAYPAGRNAGLEISAVTGSSAGAPAAPPSAARRAVTGSSAGAPAALSSAARRAPARSAARRASAQSQVLTEKAVGTCPLECRQGVRRTRTGLGGIKPSKISVMTLSSRIGEELPVEPSVRFPGSVWKQRIGLRLKYQK
ncbi:hypothetical protein DFH08DRAFT_825383 [Mycena albidolilacea]|uniref:Uncharacterized protein n=1 Tax=Mycena albidolilacea TaxID=1033008 RepID=A0AAD7E9Z8_9AGAR|nr:hypothetical protein DFH08DRAFT_825383 [Mycena albidolilacea]